MKTKAVIFWFRRDIRLSDNKGLYNALKSNMPVIPLFVFDKHILEELDKYDPRFQFIYQQIKNLNNKIKKHGSRVINIHDYPVNAFKLLLSKYDIKSVYVNRDYEPYSRKRDSDVSEFLIQHGVDFISFKDHVVFEKSEVVKKDGEPYKVYTPYSKIWLNKLKESQIIKYPSENYLDKLYKFNFKSITPYEKIGFKNSSLFPPDLNLKKDVIDNYEKKRNYPFINGTSKIGVHLRFGTISIRSVLKKSLDSVNNTYLKELAWRDFFIQILWHYPHIVKKSFKPRYDKIVWRNNQTEFQSWCNGETGYPLVDAGMRELNQTGFMHNRVRMVVGSFLCKHLLIDWRLGESYFAKKLFDFELASNVGNWQWVAGCGVDAAPYFRIFNPTEQLKKFDNNKEYIKKWVPEFDKSNYINPIVEHKFARNRCLNVYKKALD